MQTTEQKIKQTTQEFFNKTMKQMKAYRLYKGFNKIGEFDSIIEAKKNVPKKDGVYTLKGENYRDSWQIINGTYYGE